MSNKTLSILSFDKTFKLLKLYPYLTKNGLYGYADSQMKLPIPARYKSASTFTKTGFAVVSYDNYRFGVINRLGETVILLNYKTVSLRVVGEHTLACTELPYTNSLRFWEWRFWPGFWNPRDKRLFVTKVNRSHLRITVLENGQQIYSNRVGETYSHYFNIELLDEKHFIHEGVLYELNDSCFIIRAKHIFGQLDGDLLLQQVGNDFLLINQQGKSVAKSRYHYQDNLQYRIDKQRYRKNLLVKDDYQFRVARVFSDENGKQYVFPDFDKPFPTNVSLQVNNTLAADTLISKAAVVGSITGTNRFIFQWYNPETNSFRILDAILCFTCRLKQLLFNTFSQKQTSYADNQLGCSYQNKILQLNRMSTLLVQFHNHRRNKIRVGVLIIKMQFVPV